MIRGLHKLAYMRYSKNFNLSHLEVLKGGGNLNVISVLPNNWALPKKNLTNCLQFPIFDFMRYKYLHNVEPKVKINCVGLSNDLLQAFQVGPSWFRPPSISGTYIVNALAFQGRLTTVFSALLLFTIMYSLIFDSSSWPKLSLLLHTCGGVLSKVTPT